MYARDRDPGEAAPRRSPKRVIFPFLLRLRRLLPAAIRSRSAYRLAVAALLGLAAGYGSILFRRLIELVGGVFFPGGASLAALGQTPWWQLMLAPAAGGLIVGPLVHFFAREAQGHGVPEVKEACTTRGGRIRPRVALVKTLASGITIGSGGSVGREGPIVQIGSALGSFLGRALGLSGHYLVDMVASGAAAGIAATFNAPIAGVLFALEVILERSSARHFSPLIVSTVIATVVARYHLGDETAFRVTTYALVSAWELPLYVLLGGLAALVGVGFTRGLYAIEDAWKRVPGPVYLHAMLGGAIVGALAIRFPELLGVGYEHIERVLGSGAEQLDMTSYTQVGLLAFLILAKVFATGTTIGSGASGGVFAPSLFLGASLGGAFGGLANRWIPVGVVAGPGAYALVAMGAVVAATTHAPITAMLIVFELTDDYAIILPLMLSCILSAILAMRLSRESIYTLKLVRRGTHTGSSDREAQILEATHVRTLMDPTVATLRPDTPLLSLVERAVDYNQTHLYVTDRKKHLLGEVTMEEVATHVRDAEQIRRRLVARDLMLPVAGTLTVDETLVRCVTLMGQLASDQLPVVDAEGRLRGRLSQADIMSFVSRELLRRDAVLSFVRHGQPEEEGAKQLVRLPTGEVRAKVEVGSQLANKSLRELNLRVRLGVNVYAVEHPDGQATMPEPGKNLEEGETLLVVGPTEEVEHLQGLAKAAKTPKDRD